MVMQFGNSFVAINKALGGTGANATTIKPVYNKTVTAAIEASRNLRMTAWLNANPTVQKNIAMLKTAKTVTDLKKGGFSIVPTASVTALPAPPDNGVMLGLLNDMYKEQGLAQSDYLTRLNAMSQTLQDMTMQGAIDRANLNATTKAYTDLKEAPPTTTGDIDIKTILLYGGIAVGLIIILAIFMRRK